MSFLKIEPVEYWNPIIALRQFAKESNRGDGGLVKNVYPEGMDSLIR